jgi:hypothetical protein
MGKKLFAKRRSSGKRGRMERYIIGGIILALIAIVLALWGPLRTTRVAEEKKLPVQVKKPELTQKKSEKRDAKKLGEISLAKPDKTTMVAIVIDDLGQDMKAARDILSLREKIPLAVMPGRTEIRRPACCAPT